MKQRLLLLNPSSLTRKGPAGFSKWVIQRHLRIYVCLGKIEISGCNLIHTFPPTYLSFSFLGPCFVFNDMEPWTANSFEQVIVPSKVNHLPEVRKENWVVTSFLIFQTEGFQAFPILAFTDLSGIVFIRCKTGQVCLKHSGNSEYWGKRTCLRSVQNGLFVGNTCLLSVG